MFYLKKSLFKKKIKILLGIKLFLTTYIINTMKREMNSKQKTYLLHLIDKFQNGIASDEEISFLTNFYLSHQNLKEWPIEIKNKEIIKEKIFKNIKSVTSNKSDKKSKIRFLGVKNLLKYAAVLIGVLFVTIYFLDDKLFLKNEIATIKIIEPGEDKAILTLEDGTNVALEKGKSYTTENIKSNGEELVYDSGNKENSEDKVTSEVPNKPVVYNYLTIPRGGQFYLVLTDGTKVWLNSETKIKYPVSFTAGISREVELIYGEAYFDVSPSTLHNGDLFVVKSKTQQIEVIGTEFNVKAYKDEVISYTTLVEGKVALQTDNSKEFLVPNQQAKVDVNTKEIIAVLNVDIDDEISWKEGVFSFKHKTLKEIMKVLERWYDVEISFSSKNIEDVKFVGVLSKKQHLEDILTIIKNTNIINDYEINNKMIMLK